MNKTQLLASTGDPLSLIDTNPAQFREFVPMESASDGDLFYNAPYVFCGWPNDGAAVTDNGINAAAGQAAIMTGAIDSNNSSNWTTTDTPTEGRVSLINQGDIAAQNSGSGDTRAVMVLSISGASYADTRSRLDRFTVTNLGTMTNDDLNFVQLYEDDGDSIYGSGDTLVTDLGWDGSAWSYSGIGLLDLNNRNQFIITVTLCETATTGQTFRPQVPIHGAASAYTDSGPISALAAVNSLTAQLIVQAETVTDVPTVAKSQGTSNIVAMIIRITGSPSGDTLTSFTIRNVKNAEYDTDISSVKLWKDNNGDSAWDSGDSLVALLTNAGDTWYYNNIVLADSAVLASTGTIFLVTVDIGDTADDGDSFQGQIIAYGIGATTYGDGPADTVTNPGWILIQTATYTISGTVPLEAGADDSGAVVRLYNSGDVNIDTYTVQNSSGTFVFNGLLDGTYYIIAKDNHHLAQRTDGLVISSSDTSAGTTDELVAGDINDDNVINILDASYLKSVFGTSNAIGDINHDGTATEADMSYVRLHFGAVGEE